jgi:HK97 family phage portal protein
MAFWNRKENRAESPEEKEADSVFLDALFDVQQVNKQMALQIPTVSGALDLISNVISSTPIKLYRESDGKTEEIRDDYRLKLLNDEPGDTLNSNEFWRAIIRDYFLGKGGYAYINRQGLDVHSLHYVDEGCISIIKNTDPIFKDFNICVNGKPYHPFEFFKILRNTKDGAEGVSITAENSEAIETAYQMMRLEVKMAKRGGCKKGFLKSEKTLTQELLNKLKKAFSRMYQGNESENFVVLNSGIDFKEASETAVEMQVNENKKANAEEFSKIFHIPISVISGKATESEVASFAKLAVLPVIQTIECALNRDLLLESEKGTLYFAFDVKQLLKGSTKERFEAYKVALEANFMQIDEVRYMEDLEPLGLNWIKLGLQDVLYDPVTKQIYTPNTNQTAGLGRQTLKGGEGNED